MFTEADEIAALDYADAFRPDPSEYIDFDYPERTDENACDECETGVMVFVHTEYETGHQQYACPDCGYYP